MDVMLDLETMGKAAGCPVLSIGAVIFTPEQGAGEFFYRHLSLEEQMEKGLRVDGSTILWWLNQSPEARQSILGGQMRADPVELVLRDFATWCSLQGATAFWGNGSDFDLPILGAVYDLYGIKRPWPYNGGRCQRTIFSLVGLKPGAFGTKNAMAHDALADAMFQANETAGAMRLLLKRAEYATAFMDENPSARLPTEESA